MRKIDIITHRNLLNKYCNDDDLFRLIELSSRAYRMSNIDVSFADYLYHQLSEHSSTIDKEVE